MLKVLITSLLLTSCLSPGDSKTDLSETTITDSGNTVTSSRVRNLIDYESLNLKKAVEGISDIQSIKIENEAGSHSILLNSDEVDDLDEVFLARGGSGKSFKVTVTLLDGSKIVRSIR